MKTEKEKWSSKTISKNEARPAKPKEQWKIKKYYN
jgi:hypothetical protein